ncbi:MAG: nucleoside-diphosphate sugar epimerase/dehydratase, partial [Chitinophagaceae bacterium]
MSKRLNRLTRLTPSRIVLLADAALIVMGLLTAVLIRDRIINIISIPVRLVFWHTAVQLILASVLWVQFRFHRRVIRHLHLQDYVELIFAVLLLHAIRVFIWYFLPSEVRMPGSVWLISAFTTTFYLIVSRLVISYIYEYYLASRSAMPKKKLLIYGAGELGLTLKRSIQAGGQNEYRLVGYIDDDPRKIGKIVQGTEVFDAEKNLRNTIVRLGVTDIIIASKSLDPERKAGFLKDTIIFNIRIRELPSLGRWFDSQFNLNTIQQIDIHDLLNRSPIHLHNEIVAGQLRDKTILVTGAA